MTPSAVIDTHAAVWYLNADRRLSGRAKGFIDASAQDGLSVLVSPISLIEVIYLCEKGRLPLEALTRLDTALRSETRYAGSHHCRHRPVLWGAGDQS